jgi:5'-nucleotidase
MIRAPRRTRFVALSAAALLLLTVALPATAKPPTGGPAEQRAKTIDVQILGLNDYHGQLEAVDPLASSGGRIGFLTDTDPTSAVKNECLVETCVAAGGTEYLATHIANLKATNQNTVFVSAGDLIGATPLLSALFHDEPSIEAFNIMGLDYNGVGNHEFDEGVDELLRMAYGDNEVGDYEPARPDGCHPEDGCADGDGFGGADFDFLAANVVYKDSGDTIFPPYKVHDFPGGAKVAFVGMTLEGTPEIVSPEGIASVDFLDEAASVNALVPHLKRRGVEAIVVLLHEGGSVQGGAGGRLDLIDSCNAPTAPNAPNSPTGAIPQIVPMMDDEIDIVITGHTNWAVNCLIDGKVVTGAASQGRLITDIDAKIDKKTRDFVEIKVDNKVVTRDVAKAPAITALIAEYNVFAGPVAAVEVGETTSALTRSAIAPDLSESQLGRLIADAQLAHPSVSGAQIALMNPGGIRSDLNAGVITHGEAFGVQPFSNILMVRSFTGAEIEAILEQQFRINSQGQPANVILAVSEGFNYSWSLTAPLGSKVDPASITLNGQPVLPGSTYQVAMNNFLGFGGDAFPTMLAGDLVKFGADDLVALEDYLGANDPYDPADAGGVRITRLP